MNLIEQIAISPSFLLRKIAFNYAAGEKRMRRQKRKFYGAKVFQRTLELLERFIIGGERARAWGGWKMANSDCDQIVERGKTLLKNIFSCHKFPPQPRERPNARDAIWFPSSVLVEFRRKAFRHKTRAQKKELNFSLELMMMRRSCEKSTQRVVEYFLFQGATMKSFWKNLIASTNNRRINEKDVYRRTPGILIKLS